MFIITALGLITILLSLVMITNPQYWSNAIINFSEKNYFHWFEVISRFIVGGILIYLHAQIVYPMLFLSVGCLLLAVSFGLILLGENKHRQFARWSAIKFKPVFRLAGVASLLFGVFLVYISNFR